MSPHPNSPALRAIAAHRAAVEVDEASFDANCKPISKKLAAATWADEIAAFKAFAAAPCQTADDVQRKLSYILNGSVGVRTSLIECLTEEAYGGDKALEAFLRSLVTVGEHSQSGDPA
jgi:hypothetical protein